VKRALEKALGEERWDLVDALTLCRLYGLKGSIIAGTTTRPIP